MERNNLSSNEVKVVVIGLDGATFHLIKPWLAEGKLPTLNKLLKEGVHGKLLSTLPPLSPQAWTSFVTGKNPGKHGIFEFTEFKPKSYEIRFTNASSRCGKSLWRILSDHGKSVGVINVPMTYPPEQVNGFLIAGFEAPGVQSEFTYPPDLYEKIKKHVGEYDIHGDYWTTKGPDFYIQRTLNAIDNHGRVTKYLLNNYDLDFFMPVFGSTDRIQHFCWKYIDPTHPKHIPLEKDKYGDAILRVYEKVDGFIKEYLESIEGDKTVVIMSDHGAGPYYKIVYIDKWLEQQGLLKYKKVDNNLARHANHLFFGITKTFYLQLRKHLPRNVKDWLKGTMPEIRHKIESHLILSNIDWRRTKAFSMGVETTLIYINLKGRFPLGTVEPGEEYEELMDFIIDRLKELRDPDTNEAVVDNVYKKEQIYHGACLEKAPDLVVIWKNYEYITRRHYGREVFLGDGTIISAELKVGEVGELMSLEQTGSHRLEGIVIFSGKHIKQGAKLHGARIIDIAPTVLHLMGLPIPEDMDGRVLLDVFEKEYTDSHPVRYTKPSGEDRPQGEPGTYSEEEARSIEKRLQDLGYL
ncbi:MAG: alkaline phosphatase family protein [Planctomycetota bacterium]|jgi:predicted AlkP superfamily phosphohydrolase/phosphomutase